VASKKTPTSTAPVSKLDSYLARLHKLGRVVDRKVDIHRRDNVIRIGSPSCDYIWGNGHGLPRGLSAVFYGPPKSGKSVASYFMIGDVHKRHPEAIVIKFDTEMRDHAQLGPVEMVAYGIDDKRLITYQTASPGEIFDRIRTDIAALVQEGADIHMIVIDSVNGILGLKSEQQETVADAAKQIGDNARTHGEGFKAILQTLRDQNITLVGTAQVRSQMDQAAQMRGEKIKMAAAFQLQHFFEYFIEATPALTKKQRTFGGTELNRKLEKEDTGLASKEAFGKRLSLTVKGSTVGPEGRTGVMVYHPKIGMLYQAQELFAIASADWVQTLKPNETKKLYTFGDRSLSPKEWIEELKHDKVLFDQIVEKMYEEDRERQRRPPDIDEDDAEALTTILATQKVAEGFAAEA